MIGSYGMDSFDRHPRARQYFGPDGLTVIQQHTWYFGPDSMTMVQSTTDTLD
jgi:hypothetical protein